MGLSLFLFILATSEIFNKRPWSVLSLRDELSRQSLCRAMLSQELPRRFKQMEPLPLDFFSKQSEYGRP